MNRAPCIGYTASDTLHATHVLDDMFGAKLDHELYIKHLQNSSKHLLLCYISIEGVSVFELVSRLDLQAAILCGLALRQSCSV